jgi:hypothetical protein
MRHSIQVVVQAPYREHGEKVREWVERVLCAGTEGGFYVVEEVRREWELASEQEQAAVNRGEL